MNWQLDAMNAKQRAMIRDLRALRTAVCIAAPIGTAPEPRKRSQGANPGHGGASKTPNKTEAEYARLYLAGKDARFEVLTFHMANSHRYRPDWTYFEPSGRLVCVEVKGSYKLGSYQRARLAFDQAAVEWPEIRWLWAEKTYDGWVITAAQPAAKGAK